jgi:MSHA biogenesis protein MshG
MERIAIFNLPKFEMILDYFRVPLPSVMATFKGIDADLWPWVLVFAAGFILLVFSGRMLSQIFTPRGVTLGPLRVVADLLLWYMPLAGGLAQNRGMADICFTLANALDAGLSPNLAIAESAVAGSNIVLERRMRKWAREMLSRREIAPAARVARLPKVLCAMVATTRNAGDLPETLRFLSRYYDGRFSRSAILLRNAILPATAIIGGIVVMLIALGVFQPLVDLIMKMTPKR